ncbi:MAG: sulfite exporter TauE/SafE family protein [Streptosporangiaceae bacterium]
MTTGALFATGAGAGLVAGATTCAVVHAGLLTGAVRDSARPARPVAAFLGAKLAVHTVLGAALGLLGGVVQPGPSVRAVLLVAAAGLLACFALDLLGLRSEKAAGHCAPPRSRPVVLGASTVLLPCGLTLSAELLAITSGSALGGAAVMAGFVLGTAPLSGLLGLTVGLLRGRVNVLLGVAMLGLAGWTGLSGLRLGGWLPDTSAAAAIDSRYVVTDAAGAQTVTVHALDNGYRPALLAAHAGTRTTLIVRTNGTSGCTRAFEIPKRHVERLLPVTGETRLDLGVPGPGRIAFTCAAGHYPGSITFR